MLPWLLALFVTMIFVVPFDDVTAPIKLPVNATLDRFFLPALALVAVAAFIVGRRDAPRLRLSPFDVALWLFLGVVGLGILLQYPEIVERGEAAQMIKRLSVLVSYVVFFYLAVSILRPGELRAFGRLMVALGAVLAAGLIIEYLFNYNVFTSVAGALFRPQPTGDPRQVDSLGRFSVVGPGGHPLVAATLLAISLGFAAFELSKAKGLRWQLALAVVFVLLLAGGFATQRRSAAVLPVVGIIVYLVLNPRAAKRVVPIVAVAVAVAAATVPAAFQLLAEQLSPDQFQVAASTQGRVSDYDAVRSDFEATPVLGRGYGTFEPPRYRLLDNEYLKLAIDTGLLGIVSYVVMIAVAMGLALTALSLGRRHRGPPVAAVAAGLAVLAVANGLFDALGFPQMAYMFFLLAAIAVVACQEAGRVRNAARSGRVAVTS